jgi:hypothetical protein
VIDVINVAVTATSGYGGLTVDGGGGSATLDIYDQSGGATAQESVDASGTGHVDVSYVGGASSDIAYRNLLPSSDSVFSDGNSTQPL